MKQQILIMETHRGDLRAEAHGWSAEDGTKIKPGPIGMSPSLREPYTYDTPMHAIGAGWRLMCPPSSHFERWDEKPVKVYVWWFERMVDP